MSAYRIIGGDIGTRILFTVREWPIGTPPTPGGLAPVLDISQATNLRLILIPPTPILSQGASQNVVTATFYTDGTDGILQYTTISGDIKAMPLDAAPQLWLARAQFTLAGWSGKSEPDNFWVDP